MLKLIQALNSLLGMLLAVVLVVLLGVGGWHAYQNYYAAKFELEAELAASQEEVDRLEKDLETKRHEIARLGTALKFMKVNRRLARITVLSQNGSAEAGTLSTRFSFVEVDRDGKPLGDPRVFNIEGDVAYIEAWVVKFEDEYVEKGDLLRSASICMFRRVFGESQRPIDGFRLDEDGRLPSVYRAGEEMPEFERKLWSRFWDYANDPVLAQKEGVRASHGDNPSIQLRPGMSYRLELRSSAGLSIVPEEGPEIQDTSQLK